MPEASTLSQRFFEPAASSQKNSAGDTSSLHIFQIHYLHHRDLISSPFPKNKLISLPQIQQIDDTVNVMKKNLESVAQRGEHIDQLQDKSENLNQSAQGFRRGANRVRKQMWWKNVKMRIWIIVGIIFLLLIIIIPAGESFPLMPPIAMIVGRGG